MVNNKTLVFQTSYMHWAASQGMLLDIFFWMYTSQSFIPTVGLIVAVSVQPPSEGAVPLDVLSSLFRLKEIRLKTLRGTEGISPSWDLREFSVASEIKKLSAPVCGASPAPPKNPTGAPAAALDLTSQSLLIECALKWSSTGVERWPKSKSSDSSSITMKPRAVGSISSSPP